MREESTQRTGIIVRKSLIQDNQKGCHRICILWQPLI